jgi:hypothetical protein
MDRRVLQLVESDGDLERPQTSAGSGAEWFRHHDLLTEALAMERIADAFAISHTLHHSVGRCGGTMNIQLQEENCPVAE